MEGLRERKGRFKAGLVLMGYMNPFFAVRSRQAGDGGAGRGRGVHGLIVPDLPYDEAGDMRAALSAHGLALIPLVGPNTSEERMKLYADVSEGYVYVVSVMGTTGERASLPPEVPEVLSPRAQGVFSSGGARLRPARSGTARRAAEGHPAGRSSVRQVRSSGTLRRARPLRTSSKRGSPPGRAFPAFRNAPAFAARGGRSEKRSVLRPALRDVLPFRRTGGLPGVF